MKEKSAAIVTIKDAPSMSLKGRRNIANWLRRQAGFLERSGNLLSKRFTARYIYIGLLLICTLLFTSGCKNTGANVGPALLRLGVSTTAGYSMLDNPETVPAVRASTEIICSVAHGTNPSPAAIVEAVNAYGGNSQESLLIVSAAIGAYTIIYNALPATNAFTASPYALATCDGLRDALLFQGDTRSKRNDWPRLKYTKPTNDVRRQQQRQK